MEESFIDLKKALIRPPVLAFPNFDMPFVVETDASAFSFRSILTQKKEDGKFHPIQFGIRMMIEAELIHVTYEREDLDIIIALKKFRIYLFSSQPFKPVT